MSNKTILALGADIKNRFLLGQNSSFYFGPDIGDLSQAENLAFFKKAVHQTTKQIKPNIIACDLHPNYFSSLFAKTFHLSPFTFHLPVQHHHAHIASVMQEHNLNGPVLGVCFDGTGYGQDGNSWGGEFLLVDKSRFKRLAYLKYRKMPGGDRVVVEPWRMALSILGKRVFPFLKKVSRQDKELILTMLSKDINSPRTSSAGRLFDAAAALLGLCLYASFEAEGPIKLEALCEQRIDEYYRFEIKKENHCAIIDTDGLFQGVLRDLKQGKHKSFIATKFHNSMADIIVDMAERLSKAHKIQDIALSGGVFQNNFLKTKVIKRLQKTGFSVFANVKTPINDLNISLGQYYVSCSSGKG